MPAILPPLAAVRLGDSSPYTIKTLLAHLGDFRLDGAIVLCGAPKGDVLQRFPEDAPLDQEVRGCRSEWVPATSSVAYTVGIEFPVNGSRGEDWRMVVAYESNDTYAVWLILSTDGIRRPMATVRQLFAENVKDGVIDTYDRAIAQRNGGFIPLD